MPGRILGFYALSVMDAEGPLYGYMLAERVADRTDGAWRPGAGAIYPALEALTRRKLARSTSEGRRRVYRITPEGRSVLREVRRNMAWRFRGGLDLSRLWSEIAGLGDPGRFLIDNVRHRLDSVVSYFARNDRMNRETRALREQFREELRLAEIRLRAGETARPRPRGGRNRRGVGA